MGQIGTTNGGGDTAVADHIHEYDGVVAALQAGFAARTADPAVKLFETDTTGLYDQYLQGLPADKQYHNCHCCRRFIERFGGLVTIDETGKTVSAVWHTAVPGGFYPGVVEDLARRVEGRKVTGVFYTDEKLWGQPQTGPWTHFAIKPAAHLVSKSKTNTAFQLAAEKTQDYATMVAALNDFSKQTLVTAVNVLKSDTLFRSEKVLGVAEWLLNLSIQRGEFNNGKTKANLLWRAIASAPPGYAHPRSSMIGTLIEDIQAGLSFEDVKKKFGAKMHPLKYARPQAAPSQGAIAVAEKLFETLGLAPALERRYARFDELQTLWTPPKLKKATPPADAGVFGHLKPKGVETIAAAMKVPGQTMTFEKFAKTVLPSAEKIEIMVPTSGNFGAYVTAQFDDAPPILQWDREEQRNPVSHYLYNGGSSAQHWGLSAGTYAAVTGLAYQPSRWFDDGKNAHHGDGVMFVIAGAQDRDHGSAGNALFPDTLKSELHGVRSVIEAYSKNATIHGDEDASACGLLFQKSTGKWQANRIRVTSQGSTLEYCLDRWD